MGQYQSTKYNLSSETAQNYGDVINAAAPYLEEYDEIYVITEADIRALGLPTKEEDIEKLDKSKVVQAIIGHGDILDRLRENGDNEQLSQLEKQLPPLLLPRIRSSLGPFSLPIETVDRDGAPFRAGFVFLTGPQLNETLLLPKGASIDDLLKFSSRDNLSTTGFVNKVVLAHELGHLDKWLRNGIEKLTPQPTEPAQTQNSVDEPKDIAHNRKHHDWEIAADHFSFNIIPQSSEYDTTTAQKTIALFRANRVLKGVWDMVASTPEAHFTEPFLPHGALENNSYDDLLQVSTNLKGAKNQAFAELFRETLEDITHQRPESARLQSCINKTQEINAALKGLAQKPSPLLDSFEDCAKDSYDTRTLIIQKMLSRIPEGTLDHQLLTLYLNADTQLHDILDGKPLPPAPVEEKSTTAPVPFRHFSLESNF